MKKCVKLLKITLVIILLLTAIWYLFGESGPLQGTDMGQAVATLIHHDSQGNVEEEIPDENLVDERVAEPEAVEEVEVAIEPTTLVFTGDVEIGNYVRDNYDAKGIEGVISQELLDTLQGATFTMINNEFPYSDRGAPDPGKEYTFRLDPKYVSLITDLGTDVAGIANNHTLDYGTDALEDTFTTLSKANVDYTGAGTSLEDASKLVVKTDAVGRTYGFLAASHVIPTYDWDVTSCQPGVFTFYDETNLLNAIREASTQVDHLFVMVHWGIEHTTNLESYQVNDGHAFIDAGADAVIGMHTHCLQGVEYYNGHPIFYSLGNFIFGQTIKEGAAVELTYDENDDMSVRIIPVVATDGYTTEAKNNNPGIFEYIDGLSDTVDINGDGVITPR